MLPKLNSYRLTAIGSSGVREFAYIRISLIYSGCNGEQRKGYTSKDAAGDESSRVGPHLPSPADIKRGVSLPSHPSLGATVLVYQNDKCRYRFSRNTHYWRCNSPGNGCFRLEIIIRKIGHLGNVHFLILPIWIRFSTRLHDDPLSTSFRGGLERVDTIWTGQVEVDEKGTSK
jgi:hypothetical protein